MLTYERPVRFEDVDAAHIVFFARFFNYAHEAMEALFGGADGGYVGLITKRRIGFPAVKAEAEFLAPLRYGDVVTIETWCGRLGNRSATLRYRFVRQDGVVAANVTHTVVVTDLATVVSCDMPADVRAVLASHLAPDDAVTVARPGA